MNCYITFFVPQLCYCIIDLSYYDICKQDLDSVVSANESHSHTAHRSSFGRVNTSHKLGICCYKYVSKINFHRMLAPIAYNRLNPQIKRSNACLYLSWDIICWFWMQFGLLKLWIQWLLFLLNLRQTARKRMSWLLLNKC